uniref:NADH-ubiquinone oxidoreductase chain 2 n=1 Tax=Solemya velesiana TaxID=395966 RepID=A0A1W5WVE6_9BIVA|nr:NADH dehydrogenase subunit 2 [Solemya velesiana]ARH10784.1 NADH dehydrogenase subunit 2 [Solemya velesiana]
MNIYVPYNFIFLLLMTLGTIFSVSSSHWIGVWAGLEINLLGFIPMLVYGSTTLEIESSVKYFIIQSMGSGLLLLSSMLTSNTTLSWSNFGLSSSNSIMSSHYFMDKMPLFSILLLISLLIKMGLSPFHFWLPSVMSGISWISALILVSWQKIAPLILILMVMGQNSFILLMCCAISSLIGGLGGMNQTQIRALLAYSSINHLGWMVAGGMFNYTSMIIYFIIYFTISVFLFYFLWLKEKSQFRQLSYSSFSNLNEKMLFSVLILSLGGLPPLIGFAGKWLIITELFLVEPTILIFLILGSLISLFYYLMLFFTFFFSSSTKSSNFLNPNSLLIYKNSMFFTLSIMVNITGAMFILWLPSMLL